MSRDRCQRRDRGAVLPIVALLISTIVLMTAFAVDLGRQRSDRRSMQAAADVIALDMARLADGRTIDQITAGVDHEFTAEEALVAAADRNEVDRTQLTLDWGNVDPVTGDYASLTFDPNGIPDSARIIARDTTEYNFQPGSGSVTREAVGRFGAQDLAGFQVGSFGASLDTSQSAFLSTFISPLLGNPVGLTAVGYQGLAGATVNYRELGAELGLLTPDEFFDAEVPLSDVMLASAAILRRNGEDAQADILEDSITTETDDTMVRFDNIVNAEGGGESSGFDADVDIIGMIQAAATTSTCQPNPAGFDDCTGLTVPNLGTPLPLLPATTAGVVHVIQGPQYHYGPVNTGIDTGQVKLALNATFGSQAVGNCVPRLANLFCLISGITVGAVDATVRIDGLVTLFGGRNTIDDIVCTDPAALGLEIGSNTDAYTLNLTATVEFGRRGLLGGVLGPTLGSMQIPLTTSSSNNLESVTFTVAPDVLGETVRSTGVTSAGLSGLTAGPASGTGVLGTLGNLGINTTTADILDLVNLLLADIDANFLSPLTQSLGINITGSDITAEAIDCDSGSVQLVG